MLVGIPAPSVGKSSGDMKKNTPDHDLNQFEALSRMTAARTFLHYA
jgi:hypothetical protein